LSHQWGSGLARLERAGQGPQAQACTSLRAGANTLSTTHYDPDMRNATTGSCSLCLGHFPYPRHEHVTPVSRSLCLGCPTPHYHPDLKNTTLWSCSLCLGVSLPFSPPSTTQTRKTCPCGHILWVWGVFHTPDMNMLMSLSSS